MEEVPNVNNLNGVPNFGHGLPEEITKADNVIENEKETADEDKEDDQGDGNEAKEVNDF